MFGLASAVIYLTGFFNNSASSLPLSFWPPQPCLCILNHFDTACLQGEILKQKKGCQHHCPAERLAVLQSYPPCSAAEREVLRLAERCPGAFPKLFKLRSRAQSLLICPWPSLESLQGSIKLEVEQLGVEVAIQSQAQSWDNTKIKHSTFFFPLVFSPFAFDFYSITFSPCVLFHNLHTYTVRLWKWKKKKAGSIEVYFCIWFYNLEDFKSLDYSPCYQVQNWTLLNSTSNTIVPVATKCFWGSVAGSSDQLWCHLLICPRGIGFVWICLTAICLTTNGQQLYLWITGRNLRKPYLGIALNKGDSSAEAKSLSWDLSWSAVYQKT